MLYERWQEIVAAAPDSPALTDASSGRRWTFRELADAAEALPPSSDPFAHPRGTDADFVLEVLRGWRDGQIVCPLEPGQEPPAELSAGALARLPAFPEGTVHLKLTSATTGSARMVAFGAPQLAADARHIVRTMGLRRDLPNLAAISLAHSYGFSNLILPLLLEGIPLILAGSSLPDALRRAVTPDQPVTLPGVPALWRAWDEAEAIPTGTELAISAGAPLPRALERALYDRRGLKVHNFYGATECGGIAYDRTADPREDAAEIGAPMDGVTLALSAEGSLEVRGANVGLGYWPHPDERLANGCFRTGDFAELQADHVFLRGRAGDIINIAGRKLAPETVEAALLDHPRVKECVVFGVPSASPDRGEEPVAVVVVTAAGDADEAALRRHLLARLPAWQTPRHWWFVPGPLANARGKISRAAWRERYGRMRT